MLHMQYAEAKCFELFLKEGRVIAPSELENVERDECASTCSLLALWWRARFGQCEFE